MFDLWLWVSTYFDLSLVLHASAPTPTQTVELLSQRYWTFISFFYVPASLLNRSSQVNVKIYYMFIM